MKLFFVSGVSDKESHLSSGKKDVSPGTSVVWGDSWEASRQLKGSQYDKTLQPPAWDTSTALEKLYWADLEPSALWDRLRTWEEDEDVEEKRFLLVSAMRALSSCMRERRQIISITFFTKLKQRETYALWLCLNKNTWNTCSSCCACPYLLVTTCSLILYWADSSSAFLLSDCSCSRDLQTCCWESVMGLTTHRLNPPNMSLYCYWSWSTEI